MWVLDGNIIYDNLTYIIHILVLNYYSFIKTFICDLFYLEICLNQHSQKIDLPVSFFHLLLAIIYC